MRGNSLSALSGVGGTGLAHEPFHLAHEDRREGGDGLGSLTEEPAQSPRVSGAQSPRVSAVASVPKSPTVRRGPVE